MRLSRAQADRALRKFGIDTPESRSRETLRLALDAAYQLGYDDGYDDGEDDEKARQK